MIDSTALVKTPAATRLRRGAVAVAFANTILLVCLVAAAAIATAVIEGCAVNKATGQRQLILISESREIEMGRDADQQIVASLGLYPDSSLQQYVRELGEELASRSERPNLPWTFRLVDDPVVNAFALPGGFIYITRGIMAHLNSEAELAGVMGHEIGHVTGKHAVTRMSKAQVAQVGLGVGQILEPGLEKYSQLANVGLGLLFLKFSRDDETQADELGLRYMARADYDPRELVGVMTMLDRVTEAGGGGRVPEWLATHPNPGNRRQNIQSQVDTISKDLSAAEVQQERYLRKLDGLIFGQNPRQGYFQGSTFYHPDLKFVLQFPEGWQTLNQVAAVIGISPEQDAIMQLTLSQAATPAVAAEEFLSQEGVASGRPQPLTINSMTAEWAEFSAESESGPLAGMAAFIAYGGNVYQILAYGRQQAWPSYAASASAALRSFARLTDAKALAVEPLRLEIVKLPEPMTVSEFVQRYPTPVTAEKLALINRVALDAQLPAGHLVKRVVGEKIE